MTDGNTRKKAQAVFFSLVMVLSMVGGSVALAGSAAATTPTGGSLSDDVVQPGTSVSIEDVSANTDDNPLYILAANETSETINGSTLVSDGDISTSESWSTTFDPSADLGMQDGETFQIYLGEGETYSDRDNDVGSLTVDGTGPSISPDSPTDGDIVDSDTESIDVAIGDAIADNSSLQISANVDNNGNTNTYEINPDSTGTDGVDYDTGSGILTIDPSNGNIPLLQDGTVEVTVSATDAVGNSNEVSYSFEVDTDGPTSTFDLPSAPYSLSSGDEYVTGDENETVEVTLESSGNQINDEQVSFQITGPDSYDESFDYTSDSYTNSSNTFSLTPDGGETVPSFSSEGEYTVTVNAEDAAGNSITDETYTFFVDTTGPDATVDSVDNVRESTETAYVNVTFSDEATLDPSQQDVDASTIEATVNVDGEEVETVSNFAYDDEANRYYGTLDLTSGGYDGIENLSEPLPVVNVTAADDLVGNELQNPDADVSEGTFNIDTDGPSVNVESPGQNLGGYVNFTSLVTTSDTEASSVEILVGEDPNSVLSIGTLDDARDYNTAGLPDGTHTLRVSVDDDASPDNSDTDTATFTLDNQQAVDVQQPYLAGVTGAEDIGDDYAYEVDGQFNLSTDVFDAPADATYDISPAPEDGSDVEFDADDYNDGETVTLSATANGFTATTEVKVVAVKETDTGVQVTDANGDQTADNPETIEVTVNSELNSLDATVADTDAYFSDESIELTGVGEGGDFTLASSSGDQYIYTASMPSSLRDGQYQVTVNEVSSATQTRDLGATSSVFTIDNNTPTITDADISGNGTDGRTQVRVQFSEPVNVNEGTVEGITASDGTAVNDGIDVDGSDGEVVVEFNDVLQTGDGVNVTYADSTITENFDATAKSAEANDGEITRMVDTIDLQLSEGQNLVSVPAETGTVALSDLNTENVETVYAWDDGSWTGYTPGDETSDLENLEGGQGYVFTMSAADEIAVQAYNKPGAVEGGVAPMTDEDIEEGWNLIGHFQEAPQDRGTALMELDAATFDAAQVLGEQSDGSYGPVAEFQPGEGYWLHADQTDNYAATPFDGSPVLSGLSVTGSAGTADVVAAANTETISLSIEADDIDGVDTVEFTSSVDETTATLTDDGTGTYTADVDIDTTGESGSTDLGTITATDIVGDSSEDTVTATVDDGIDTASITSPTAESPTTLNTDETLSVDYSAEDTNFDSATVKLLANDDTELATRDATAGTGQTVTFDLSSAGEGIGAGEYDVELVVDDTAGNSLTIEEADSVVVDDGSAPTISSPDPADGTTVTTTSQTYTVGISDATSGVDASSITVTTTDGANADLTSAGTDNNRVSYDAQSGTLTVDAPSGEYTDGNQISVTVNADDNAGNSATEFSSTFTVDTNA